MKNKIATLQTRKNSNHILKMLISLLIIFTVSIQFLNAITPKYNLRFVEVKNTHTKNGDYEVLIQMKAEDTSFEIGSSTLSFNYNKDALNRAVLLTAHTCTNIGSLPYKKMGFSKIHGHGIASVIIEYTGNNGTPPGVTIGTQVWVDIATIQFMIRETGEFTNFTWRLENSKRHPLIVKDHNGNNIAQGTEMGTLDAPLPVELISFTAVSEKDASILNWSTASEKNNYGFYVERSGIERSWETVGFVAGNGNASNIIHYEYTDFNVFDQAKMSATFYYRLKQVDYDGTYEYSDVKIVRFESNVKEAGLEVEIYPNPASDFLNIKIHNSTENARYQFYNLDGRIVNESNLTGFNSTIDISNLTKGIYQLIIIDNNKIVNNTRIMIQ